MKDINWNQIKISEIERLGKLMEKRKSETNLQSLVSGTAYAIGDWYWKHSEEARKEITEVNKKIYAHIQG